MVRAAAGLICGRWLTPTQFNVVQNFFEELRQVVPD